MEDRQRPIRLEASAHQPGIWDVKGHVAADSAQLRTCVRISCDHMFGEVRKEIEQMIVDAVNRVGTETHS